MSRVISKSFGYCKAQKASMGEIGDAQQNARMDHDSAPPAYADSGRRLRLLRLAVHEMDNQRLFAEQHGFSPTQWNNYEKGTSRPKPEDALRLKQKFGVTTDWIYDGTEALMPKALLQRIYDISVSILETPKHRRRTTA